MMITRECPRCQGAGCKPTTGFTAGMYVCGLCDGEGKTARREPKAVGAVPAARSEFNAPVIWSAVVADEAGRLITVGEDADERIAGIMANDYAHKAMRPNY